MKYVRNIYIFIWNAYHFVLDCVIFDYQMFFGLLKLLRCVFGFGFSLSLCIVILVSV